MTTGKGTVHGLAVPIYGESEIKQETAGTDILTLTSVADTTAANHLRVNMTATSAITAGYTQGVYVSMNLAGGMTGGSTVQQNAFATDITLSGTNTAWVTGMYVYICEGTSAEVSAGILNGYCAWFAALGDNALIRSGFHAGSEETAAVSAAAGTCDGAFVAECAVAGSWKSLLVTYGGPPEEFLHITETTEEQMYSTRAVGSAAAYLKVNVAGTIMWLTLAASCSS